MSDERCGGQDWEKVGSERDVIGGLREGEALEQAAQVVGFVHIVPTEVGLGAIAWRMGIVERLGGGAVGGPVDVGVEEGSGIDAFAQGDGPVATVGSESEGDVGAGGGFGDAAQVGVGEVGTVNAEDDDARMAFQDGGGDGGEAVAEIAGGLGEELGVPKSASRLANGSRDSGGS